MSTKINSQYSQKNYLGPTGTQSPKKVYAFSQYKSSSGRELEFK